MSRPSPALIIEIAPGKPAVAYLIRCKGERDEKRLLADLRQRDVMREVWVACRALRDALIEDDAS